MSTAGDASPAMSPGKSAIKEIKARLRQLGVSDDRIAQCVEKSELNALLEQVCVCVCVRVFVCTCLSVGMYVDVQKSESNVFLAQVCVYVY